MLPSLPVYAGKSPRRAHDWRLGCNVLIRYWGRWGMSSGSGVICSSFLSQALLTRYPNKLCNICVVPLTRVEWCVFYISNAWSSCEVSHLSSPFSEEVGMAPGLLVYACLRNGFTVTPSLIIGLRLTTMV